MPTSPAEIFINLLKDDAKNAFEHISALIDNQAEENEWREFKEAAFIDVPNALGETKLSRKSWQDTVKEYWSENLSAFANSGGGLLIWGIKTKGNKALKKSLATNAVALAARLDELKNEAVDPPVLGVEVIAVCEKNDDPMGFVVCFVPDSKYSPHRAIFRNGGFYIRAGDSSRSMKTEILRRMFYPRLVSNLCLTVRVDVVSASDGALKVQACVSVKNEGSASARDTVINVRASLPATYHKRSEFWVARPGSENSYMCHVTIHPQEEVPFISNIAFSGGYNMSNLPEDLVISFRIFSLNAPSQAANAIFNPNEINSGCGSAKVIAVPVFE